MPPLSFTSTPAANARPDDPLALSPALLIAAQVRRTRQRKDQPGGTDIPHGLAHLFTRASDPDAEDRLCRQAADLVANHRTALERFVRGYAGRRARRGDGWVRGERDMVATIRQLGKHAWPLAEYLDMSVSDMHSQIISHPSFPTVPLPLSAPSLEHLEALATWFKSSFMRWIDPIPCPRCGGSTTGVGSASPSPSEAAQGGGRVELHKCTRTACGTVRRFVRYSSVRTLMQTREGRCGEWAHLFYAMLRVLGAHARYVWNSEDHVWVEAWAEDRWVHVDPCEAAVDKPLVYAKGWGKKQGLCIAIGPDGAQDVTRAYVDDWPECLARRRAKGWDERTLDLQTISLRMQMSSDEQQVLDEKDRLYAVWLHDEPRRLREFEARERQGQIGGRESGPAEWRAARDELGPRPTYKTTETIFDLSHDLYLLGTAERRSGRISLTTGPSQTAAVFTDLRISRDQSLRVRMRFSIVGDGGADGIALVFVKERGLGVGGFGLGYEGLGGEGDFAVEVDTYRSQDHADDPPTPHVSLHSPPRAHHRHSLACSTSQLAPLDNVELEVVYDANKRSVWAAMGEVTLWEATTLPRGEGDWVIGVTAACGGLWQTQELIHLTVEKIVTQ